MGKGEENPSPSTSSSSNPPSSDIPTTTPNLPNYIHSYYGAMPAWSPAFMPYPDIYHYPTNMQMNDSYPFEHGMGTPVELMDTSPRTEERVGQEDTVSFRETGALPCSTSRVDEQCEEDRTMNSPETGDGTAETPECDEMYGGDMIGEPKVGMEFNSFEELMSYYKLYAKKCGFGSMTQRSERDANGVVRYVTLGCARGGKARNRTMNVAKPRPTGKTDCKAMINALKVEGKLRVTTVHNTHNHGLSPHKSRFFRCNRQVSKAVKRVLDTNDLAGIRMNKSFSMFQNAQSVLCIMYQN